MTLGIGQPARIVRPAPTRLSRSARGWPLFALLCFFPLWWALGLSTFIFPILAVPMALHLLRNRPVRVPPGFGIWLMFCLWILISLIMLPFDPPGTLAGSALGRLISVLLNIGEFAGVTVTLLYVGNLDTTIVTQRRVISWLGTLFIATVIGGLLGVLVPTLSFTSPIEYLLPGSLRADPYIQAITHPTVAQVQAVLGYENPRPSAPFGYTNFWGNNLSLLLVWFAAGWWALKLRGGRVFCVVVLAIAMVPVVYSLNRGLWLGVGLSVLYLVGRLILLGRLGAVAVATAALLLGTVAFVATPLGTMVSSRFEHGHSDNIRGFLNGRALDGAKSSPILGYGGTRKTMGSDKTITVGKTPKCPQCGNFAIGSTGQVWSLLFSHGFVGTGLFLGFFAYSGWRYRRDVSPIGIAGVLVVGLTFVYMFFYNSVPAALTITMISVALLWRNDLIRRGILPDGDAVPAGPVRERIRRADH
jgi:hypothetical protein